MTSTDFHPAGPDRPHWDRNGWDEDPGHERRHRGGRHHRRGHRYEHGHDQDRGLLGTILDAARRIESWLDDRGKGAWIAVMVLGFVFAWPVGLALLAYMIWSKRMFSHSCRHSRSHSRDHSMRRDSIRAARAAMRPSGNSAFDSYKAETLRRLEDEQQAFEDFLGRLRAAKDKAEFDQFMEDRARRPQGGDEYRSQDGEDYRRHSDDDSMPEPPRT